MIVTTNLAKDAVTMAKRKTVVKHLNSIQNFGAMDVLCTDKTGTLTQDKITLERQSLPELRISELTLALSFAKERVTTRL